MEEATHALQRSATRLEECQHELDTIDDRVKELKNVFKEKSEIVSQNFFIAENGRFDAESELNLTIKNYFKNTEITVLSDLLGSCRALCKDKRGVVSILGTGSNSCYYDGNDINMQINSLGYLLGDEGSGYALGRSFLKKYLRSELSDNTIKSFENEYKISKENFKIIYEKNSNRWISKLSEFVYKNKEDSMIREIILNHFKYYFEEIICKYDSKSLYLSGSVAYYFKNEISNVSDLYQIKIVKVLKDPINHLVDFHVE